MRIDDDKYIDFSLAQKDTLISATRCWTSHSLRVPAVRRTPKKMHLERMPLSGTTSAIISAIRKIRVECLPEYFEQTCDRRPSNIAVISGSSRLTYEELDLQANRLAHFLISRGVRNGNPVGILLERSARYLYCITWGAQSGCRFRPT